MDTKIKKTTYYWFMIIIGIILSGNLIYLSVNFSGKQNNIKWFYFSYFVLLFWLIFGFLTKRYWNKKDDNQ
jgi:tellurite resistance protein TehA-like permease